jgi:transposase
MIKKTIVHFRDGSSKTLIRVLKSFRPGSNQNSKQVTIKNFGYLEDQTDLDAFWAEVNEVDENMKKGYRRSLHLSIPLDSKNNDSCNKKYNYGYRFIEAIFEELKLESFFNQVDFKGDYSLYEVFEFLVYQRILNPQSKRASFQEVDKFYNKSFHFSLADIYRALDKFSDISISLQVYLNQQIKKIIGRDSSYAFYDVTNYYFEKDFNGLQGTYPQRGVSKEHQLGPIVQLGLFMDSNNLPIAMKAYPGNTSDSITLQPAMADVKKDFNLGRLIIVADKGLNSTSNIDYIVNSGDGYVVSQVLKGPKGSKYHELMFNPEGYEGNENFRYKLFEENYESHINSKKTVIRRRKVLIYWSKEDASYAKAKRVEKTIKAERDLTNNAYSIDHSKRTYITTQYFNDISGEQANKAISGIDYEKISEEEKFDGYFCIITSELNYDYKKILEVYRNLWHIEESFKITKSDLETRPMYVTTQKHIDGHMLVCYTALLALRLVQYKLGEKILTANRIKQVLNSCECMLINEGVVWLNSVTGYSDYIAKIDRQLNSYLSLELNKDDDLIRKNFIQLMSSFEVDLDKLVLSRNEFNKELKRIKYKIKKA